MTTLAIMKARIHAETRRPSTNTVFADAVAAAIATAIESYRTERFAFKEKRSVTFTTTDGTEFYTTTSVVALALLEKIDYVKLIISNQPYTLSKAEADWIESASVSGTQEGQPTHYCWYEQGLRLYPIPSTTGWTVRVAGNYHIAAPASDSEASNPWMVAAEQLIRCRAKYELYEHVILDADMAQRFHPEPQLAGLPPTPTSMALSRLRGRNTLLTSDGLIQPMSM